ncbi:MAG TPA: RNA-directed DNA polymerase [Actinomycetota bacterium]|nr:RNA-directed DNA polymerase [Actinomycetota bacterium]
MVETVSDGRVGFVSVRHAGGVRVLTLLGPAAREEYLALVAPVAPAIESALSDRVVAHRVAWCEDDPPTLRLRPWRIERRAFAIRLRDLLAGASTIAIADVRRCYASISPSTVERVLGELGVGSASEVGAFLSRLERAGGRGLPVGPQASAVLANAVLASADEALRAAGVAHLRWVDDVVIAAAGPSDAERAIAVLGDAVAGLGLRLNERKTRIDPPDGGVGLAGSARAIWREG